MQASVGCKGMIMESSSPWVTIKYGVSLEFSSLITIVKFLFVQDISVQKVYIPATAGTRVLLLYIQLPTYNINEIENAHLCSKYLGWKLHYCKELLWI